MRILNYFFVLLGSLLFFQAALAVESVSTSYTEKNLAFTVSENNPQFTIKLTSNPTTGYRWFLRNYDANLIQPVKHAFLAADNKKLIGAPGYEVWRFKVKPAGFSVPQQTIIRFVYARPFEMNDDAKQLVFNVTTTQ
ncbi:MAG: hypothetical protein ACD_60C00015G0030 [uncultured bacterium]|nr:MAG: hypothetical protein ACD_60C00015G0030 [uncultured bacterium]